MIDFKRVEGQEPDKKLEELANVLSSRLWDLILIAFLNDFRLRSKRNHMLVSMLEKFFQERKQFQKTLVQLFLSRIITNFLFGTYQNV
jgi:hypothetical protein